MPAPTLIQTRCGYMVDPFHLSRQDIDLSDIAHALSNLCRFTGHTARFYSVAEHCVRVAATVDVRFLPETEARGVQALALLHDASEAYLQDIPSPIKYSPAFSDYRNAERRAMDTIHARFRIAPSPAALVRVAAADRALLQHEAAVLMTAASWEGANATTPEYAVEWSDMLTPMGWPPRVAKRTFLEVAGKLGLLDG